MTEYRLFQGVSGPGSQEATALDLTVGVEFYVDDSPLWVRAIHFWSSTTLSGTFPGRLYAVDAGGTTGTAVAGTDVTLTSITAGWNSAIISPGVQLTPGQRYRAAVLVTTDNGFTSTAFYWGADHSSGPLHAPSTANALGNKQGCYHLGSTLAFPGDTASSTNYWVDATVTDVDYDALNASLWAVDPSDGHLTALPHFTRLAVSEERNGIGKVEVDYPAYGQGFDLLAANITSDRDLEVEVWMIGKQTGALRGILTDTTGDDVAEDAVWRFEGWTLNVLLDEVLVWPQSGAEKQELVLSTATAGTVVSTLVGQAQGRGGLAGVTLGFNTSIDSDGVTWANVVTATFSPSATLLDVLQELVEIGMIDGFRLGADRVLDMWNPDGQGTDLTVTTPPVVFRRGKVLTESPRRHTVRNSATTVLAAGAENLYEDADDASALARRGRRIEIAGSSNSLTSSGGVLAYAQSLLDTVTPGAQEVTHGLILGPGLPIPWVDYAVGDWVWSDTRTTLDRLRIQQLEIEYGVDGYAGTVVLNTPVVDRVAALARKVKRISSGTAVVGTSTLSPETDDGKSPAQVTGVSASSSAYVTNGGGTLAAVQAGWTAVTTNADATAADDIVGYFPAYRYGSGQSLSTDWQVQPQVSGTVADWDGVVPGKSIGVRVAAVDQWGHVGAWSSEYTLTSGADATPPPTPSTPVVDSYLGILTVTWDGLGSVGESQPVDFDRVEVHVSTSSGFTPSSGTRIDSLRTKGVIPWADGTYGVTYYAKLIAYDKTGNASAASAQGSATLVQAGDGDISALSIGKLTAGTLSAIMTLSSIIRTASSGDRVEIDTDGIHCYDGSTLVFDFDLSAGTVYLRGSVEAYQSATDRIVIQPSGAGASGVSLSEISLYASTLSPGYINGFPATGSRTGLGMNSGNSADSGTTRKQSTLRLFPTSFDLSVNTAPGDSAGVNLLRGGKVQGSTTEVALVLGDSSSGTGLGLVTLHSDEILSYLDDGSGGRDGGFIWLKRSTDCYFGFHNSSVDAYFRAEADGDIQITPHSGRAFTKSAAGVVNIYGPSTSSRLSIDSGETVILGTTGSTFIRLNAGGGAIEFYENGTGYGSLGALKSFVIDHPLDPARLLVHGCTESPQAGVEYWGEVEIRDGFAEVELPGYFEAATRLDGRQVQLTPVDELCLVAASQIEDGQFTVRCSGPDGTRVAWLVKAVRADVPPFDPEPLRSEVDVRGAGPYRYIVPPGER